MKSLSITISLLLLFTALTSAVTPKLYNLELDLSPEGRWLKIVSDYKDQINVLIDVIRQQFNIPEWTLELFRLIDNDLFLYIDNKDYAEEIIGIAKFLNKPPGEILLLNLIYDLTAFCTSIVVQDTKGNIIHGRNLDYKYAKYLENMTIDLNVTVFGKPLYRGITYAGYVGLLSAVKYNAFTITLNERDKGDLVENLFELLINRKSNIVSFEARSVVESVNSYEEALKLLRDTTIVAPCYIILGGVAPGEGAVIVRDRLAALHISYLGEGDPNWYVLQTNYDPWVPPPSGDDRRDPGKKMLNDIGQSNITADTLFSVLSTPPVCNDHTTYTLIMSAANSDLYRTVIRKGDTQCNSH